MSNPSARRASLALALALALTSCASEDPDSGPEATPTPIAKLESTELQVPRIEFCGLVPGGAVSDALGGKAEDEASWSNGEEVALPDDGPDVPEVEDVVHELGCAWTGASGATARAWVFARPVDPAFARAAIRSGRGDRPCRTGSLPAFGSPGATQTCRFPDGRERVRHAGLFGQTWLTCEVVDDASKANDLRSRTDEWCVEVANALNTAG